jgi:hypothetical protein
MGERPQRELRASFAAELLEEQERLERDASEAVVELVEFAL